MEATITPPRRALAVDMRRTGRRVIFKLMQSQIRTVMSRAAHFRVYLSPLEDATSIRWIAASTQTQSLTELPEHR